MTTSGEPPTDDARKFISSFIAAQSAYHDHKETTTYWAVGLYLAGAAWILTTDPSRWGTCTSWEFWGFLVFVLVLGVVGLCFVHWQLKQRRHAAIQVAAAYNLASRWLTKGPTNEELRVPDPPDPYVVIQWPKALHDAICKVTPAQTGKLRSAECLTRITVIVAGLFALGRLLLIAAWRAGAG